MTRNEEEVVEKARLLFERGAEVVYLMVDDGTVSVTVDPPERPGTIVSARSIHEVRRFVRDA